MTGVSDHNNLPPGAGLLADDFMNTLHERTRRVDHFGMAVFQFPVYRAGHAVGADDHPFPLRQLRSILYDRKPLFLQQGNGVPVVDELSKTAARAGIKRLLRHADRPLHAKTEPRAASQNVLCRHVLIPPA